MINALKNWVKDWYITIVFGLLIVVVISSAYFQILDVTFAQMLVLAITLIAVLIYAEYTHRIAEANLIIASPTVSLDIQSGKHYYKSPNLSNEQLYETRVIVKNLSRYPVEAYVNLNLRSMEKPVSMADIYCGKKPWVLNPLKRMNGQFNIGDVRGGVGIDVNKMKREKTQENVRTQLTMTIEVQNAGVYRRLIKYPVRHWHFDFQRDEWYNEDFGYYA